MVGINKMLINGRFVNYLQLTAQYGYCFYDADADDRHYMTSITIPVISDAEIERKYIVVQGNADKLNEELAKESEENDRQ